MPDLSSNSQKQLLELAREAIKGYLATGDIPKFETDSAELHLKRGCFVTLRKGHALRGCIGTFEHDHPVFENVIRMAIASATRDPRFSAVTKSELALITIEISVLGELEKVGQISEIQIGKHGVLIKHGNRSGTYLPDVAVEQKWSVEEFVTYCAREKAGLDPDECATAEVFRYEVQKFEEKHLKS